MRSSSFPGCNFNVRFTHFLHGVRRKISNFSPHSMQKMYETHVKKCVKRTLKLQPGKLLERILQRSGDFHLENSLK